MTQPHLPPAIWFDILHAGFNSKTLPLSETSDLTIFNKWFLRAGYINFPFGISSDADRALVFQSDILDKIRQAGVDFLRFRWPDHFGGYQKNAGIRTPETNIPRLENWSEEKLDSDLRYKIRRAKRNGVKLRHATINDARSIFRSYQETILRHRGKVRYTEDYFLALCKQSIQQPALLILIAETTQGEFCGFNVSIYRAGLAYYVHGGIERHHAHLRPGFLLMNDAISSARDSGCHEFNFMPSPTNQPSLHQFKKKWGGATYDVLHFDHPLTPTGKFVKFAISSQR